MYNINYELFSPLSVWIEPVTTSLICVRLLKIDRPYLTDSSPAFALILV